MADHLDLISESAQKLLKANPKLKDILMPKSEDPSMKGLAIAAVQPTTPSRTALEDYRAAVPEVSQQFVFETIVNRYGRPALLVDGKTFSMDATETAVWQDRLNDKVRAAMAVVFPSVGRVKVQNNTLSWLGTGWLLPSSIIVTNRHVALEFAMRGATGASGFDFRPGILDPGKKMSSSVNFGDSVDAPADLEFRVVDILHIEQDSGPDMALLKVESRPIQGNYVPGELIFSTTPAKAGQTVGTVGYPAMDSRIPDFELERRIFGDVYNVKRFAPGEIKSSKSDLVTHDCSTLGGNSGSPIVDLDTGVVLGLHFSGLYLQENRGVSAALVRSRVEAVTSGRTFPSAAIPQGGERAGVSKTAVAAPATASTVTPTSGTTVNFKLEVPIQVTVAILGQPTLIPVTSPATAAVSRIDDATQEIASRVSADPDVLSVRAGYAFEDGWITNRPAVVVVLRDSRARERLSLPTRLGRFAVEVRDPGLADFEAHYADVLEARTRQTTYKKPTGFSLQKATVSNLIAHVSPDCGWPLLKDFLSGTRERLTVGMYDMTAPNVVNAVKAAVADGSKTLEMVCRDSDAHDKTGVKKDDLSDAEAIQALKDALGDRFQYSPPSVGAGRQFASAYHIKVAVRDGGAFWLSSGNWQSTNQNESTPEPDSTDWWPLKNLNREWHIIIENEDLSRQYEQYLKYDFECAQKDVGAADEIIQLLVEEPEVVFEARPPTGKPKYRQPLHISTPVDVQPLLTPDNYLENVLELIQSAGEEVLFQNQSFNLLYDKEGNDTNDPRFAKVVDALLAKQQAGLDVRIIIRGEFNPQTPLERLQMRGFDMSKVRLQDHCHTKGIVVDGRRVCVGSHNWTNDGTLFNRDASLIIESREVAEYFRDAFQFDWDNLARPSVGAPRRVRPTGGGGDDESVAEAGFFPRKVSLLSLLD